MKSPAQDQLNIRRMQLDKEFMTLRPNLPGKPRKGWVKEIRTALQMTTAQLARRLGKSQSAISKFEKNECEGTITLNSLNDLAEALECELHYTLVPKKPLQEVMNERAEKIFLKEEKVIDHQMELEGQGTSSDTNTDIEIAFLIASRDKRIWDDE